MVKMLLASTISLLACFVFFALPLEGSPTGSSSKGKHAAKVEKKEHLSDEHIMPSLNEYQPENLTWDLNLDPGEQLQGARLPVPRSNQEDRKGKKIYQGYGEESGEKEKYYRVQPTFTQDTDQPFIIHMENDHTSSAAYNGEESGPLSPVDLSPERDIPHGYRTFVPPDWMSENVKNYFAYWNNYRNKLKKYINGKIPDKPQRDHRMPWILEEAIQLKREKKLQERTRGKDLVFNSMEEIERDNEEDDMIDSESNMRASINALQRAAVAKELHIRIKDVTREIGRQMESSMLKTNDDNKDDTIVFSKR